MKITGKNAWVIILAGIILFIIGYFVGQELYEIL